IWADGRLLVETDDPNPRLAPGRIVLQSRTPETLVQFRKIEIQAISANPPAASPPDPAVVQPLRDLVAAKARVLEAGKAQFEAGKVSRIELRAAEADWTEARIRLAEAEQKKEAMAALLEELVKQRQEERDLIAQRVEVGFDRREILDQADARPPHAKAPPAPARLDAPPTVAPPPPPQPSADHPRPTGAVAGQRATNTRSSGASTSPRFSYAPGVTGASILPASHRLYSRSHSTVATAVARLRQCRVGITKKRWQCASSGLGMLPSSGPNTY